ncbi:hypothetical protein V8C86DRAFT_3018742 [Haematococcus lacustris]
MPLWCLLVPPRLLCVQAATRPSSEPASFGSGGSLEADHLGPCFRATLAMLEWPLLCSHLADFASTRAGKRACAQLLPPASPYESEQLLRLTRATTMLEVNFTTALDFGGINTVDSARALTRANKGGVCTPGQLRAVASLVTGVEKLRKQIQVAGRVNDALGPDGPIWPLLEAVSSLLPQPSLARAITSAIDEENQVMDSASEALRLSRQRVKGLQARLTTLLKGYGGEVSERGGRYCQPGGSLLLGSSTGGSVLYVEPPAAVIPNNELAAARGEAYSAQDAVLFSLTGQLLGVWEEVQAMYERTVWLDVLAAKCRYGQWLRGVLPTLVPWGAVFQPRSRQPPSHAPAGWGGYPGQPPAPPSLPDSSQHGAAVYDDEADLELEEEVGRGGRGAGGPAPPLRYAVRLRGLRHPLLYGQYLRKKQQLEREFRLAGGTAAALQAASQALAEEQAQAADSSSSSSSSGTAATRSNQGPGGAARSGSSGGGGGQAGMSRRREEMLRAAGLEAPSTQPRGKAGRAEQEAAVAKLAAELVALKPPVPVDLAIKPETSVVVITGPNTGGKTATMKALGLAAVMARCGLALPAEPPAALPCFSAVLGDIGDEQSLTANLSTFSGHLKRIQALRAEADGRSLVLLDELGTGTDPIEGAALGVALLKRMVQGGLGNGALTIATTHHSIMTGLKFDDPMGRFENASVEFDEVALAPTYRLLWGIPGRSNALNIAARLGLEEEVVAAARSRLDDSVVRADTAVAALEEVRDTVQGEESALWAVEQEVAAIQAEVTARRMEVRVLQSELAAATEKALFDVWLEARRRLRQIRQAKRAPAPAVKRALSPAQALEVLATQITNPGQQELQGSGSSSSSSMDKDRDSATSPHTQRVSPAPPSHLAPGAQPALDQVGVTARAAAGEEEEGDDDDEEEGEVGEQQEEDEMSVSLEELQGLDMSMGQLLEQQIEMRHQARLMAAEKERLAEQAYDSAVMGFEQLITAMPVAPPSRQAVAPHPPPSTAVSVPNEQEGVQEEDIEELEQQFPAASVIQQQSAKDTRRQQKSGRTVGAQSQNQQHHQQQQQQQQQGAEKEVVAGVTASQVSYDDEYELLVQQWDELQAQVHSSRQAPAPAAPTASKQTATEAASAPFDALDLDELIQGLEDASDVRLKLAPESSHISPRSSSRHSAASQNDVMTQRTQRGASANNARLQSDDAAMSEEDELSSLITMLEELPQPPVKTRQAAGNGRQPQRQARHSARGRPRS